MLNDNPINAAIYVAWEEYYNQISRMRRFVKGRGHGPWEHKYLKHFTTIAEACVKHEVRVRQFMETAFALLRSCEKEYIRPSDIANADLLAATFELLNHEGIPMDYAACWLGQLSAAQKFVATQPDVYPDLKTALMVPTTGLESWFRVLLLHPFDEDLFKAYGKAAWQDLSGRRGLRDFLRQQVPRNMAEFEKSTACFGDA